MIHYKAFIVTILTVNVILLLGYCIVIQFDPILIPAIPKTLENKVSEHQSIQVEIWSKAAIGQYVWEHIIRGNIEPRSNQFYIEGRTQIDSILFTFRSGPSLRVQNLQSFTFIKNLILIVNWRNQNKINYSIPWLETAIRSDYIQNIGIIALGNEQCNNEWFIERYSFELSKIQFLFIVYDWNRINNNDKIYQWPLGIATYRNFPSNNEWTSIIQMARPYRCNYIATIYPNSSREELSHLFETNLDLKQYCILKLRNHWEPMETEQSMAFYVESLRLSELTLSPIGHNHECYRILEAVEYGSIPVIEIDHTILVKNSSNLCDKHKVLRLFFEYDAPFIYVNNWTKQLPGIILQQIEQPEDVKRSRRIQLIKWYHRFKNKLRQKLINIIKEKFT